MEEILKPYLVELLELVKSTGSFIIGELPAISKEIITWGIVENIISFLTLFVIFVLTTITTIKIKKSKENIFETSGGLYGSYVYFSHVICFWVFLCFACIFGIVFFCCGLENVSSICKAIFAPRLFLIEQLQLLLG